MAPSGKTATRFKVLTVGDGYCGKTALQLRFVTGEFSHVHGATVFDNYVANLTVDGEPIQLALWDTAGQEDYSRLRPLSYPETSVVLLCFSVELHQSLSNVTESWYPEVRHFCPDVPVVLVANKIDLRRDRATVESLHKKQQKPIASAEGVRTAKKIKAFAYHECSALTGNGVATVFETAARAALLYRSRRRTCGLL